MRKSAGNRNIVSLIPMRVKTDSTSTGSAHGAVPKRTSGGGRQPLTSNNMNNPPPAAKRKSSSSSYGPTASSTGPRQSTYGTAKATGSKAAWGTSSGGRGMGPPASKMRRSSGLGIGRGYNQQHAMKDPRPISDKSYKDRTIRDLVAFLQELNYPHPITAKKLLVPLTNDFFRIFEFMYGFLSPNFKLSKKPEEDVPRIFQLLGYPFAISKSNMFSIGTPHMWPTLLAALKWLMEIVQYAINLDVESTLFPQIEFEEIPESRVVFSYVEEAYEQFLAGEDSFDQLEQDLEKQLKLNCQGGKTNLDSLTAEHSRLSKELEQLENEGDKVTEWRVKHKTCQDDLEKLTNYVQDLKTHKCQQEKLLKGLQEELLLLDMEYKQLQEENKKKRHIFETQEFSQADVERINMTRLELKSQIESIIKEMESIEQQIWHEEMIIAKSREQSEEKCIEYNKMAHKLKLIPLTAENAHGINFEMRPNLLHGSESTDFIGTIKPSLMRMKKDSNDKVHQLEARKITEMETLDQVTEMVSDKKEAVSMLDSKYNHLEEEISCHKTTMQAEFHKMQLEKNRTENDILSLQNPGYAVDEATIELQAAQKRCEESKQAQLKERNELCQVLQQAATIMMDSKSKTENQLRKMVEEQKKEVERVNKDADEFKLYTDNMKDKCNKLLQSVHCNTLQETD